jgi:hypothetical protein
MDAWVLRSEVWAGGNYFYPAFRVEAELRGMLSSESPDLQGGDFHLRLCKTISEDLMPVTACRSADNRGSVSRPYSIVSVPAAVCSLQATE